MQNLFIGTSGYSYKNWGDKFYPEKTPQKKLLDYYGTQFNSVEINGTFYNTPSLKSVENWVSQVPKDFVFAIKGSRFITHLKKLNIEEESFRKFFEPLESLKKKGKKYIILFQFAANFKLNFERFESFISQIPPEFRYAFEFRDESWFTDDIFKLLRKHNSTVVMNDSPIDKDGIPKWPITDRVSATYFYIRFHGSKKLYISRYEDHELQEYAEFIKEKLDSRLSVYCYFNNDAAGHAPFDAIRLREMIEKLK